MTERSTEYTTAKRNTEIITTKVNTSDTGIERNTNDTTTPNSEFNQTTGIRTQFPTSMPTARNVTLGRCISFVFT